MATHHRMNLTWLCATALIALVGCGPAAAPCGPNERVAPGGDGCACETPLRECDGQCLEVTDDRENCGECGVTCGEDQRCDDGVCACEAPLSACETDCVSLDSDPNHCGACDAVCPASAACVEGVCQCPADSEPCGDACVNVASDPGHCGACGVTCDGGAVCTDGECACPRGWSLCDGRCVDTASDPEGCGTCDPACGAGELCLQGACETYEVVRVGAVVEVFSDDDACCQDVDGDGAADNGGGWMLSTLSTLADSSDPLWRELVAVHGLSFALVESGDGERTTMLAAATNDMDGDGVPDASFDERVGGRATFARISEPMVSGVWNDGEVWHYVPAFPIWMRVADQEVELIVDDLLIEGQLKEEEMGLSSVDVALPRDGETVMAGGITFSGTVSLAHMLDALDEEMRDTCGVCAGIPRDTPFLTHGENVDTGSYDVECGTFYASGCTEDDGYCVTLETWCGFALGALAAAADLDLDDDGVNETFGLGLRLRVAPATLVEPEH